MGCLFSKTSGRGWRLREQSMELWPKWIQTLSGHDNSLTLHTPLVQLARSEKERIYMEKLIETRSHLGLKVLSNEAKQSLKEYSRNIKFGGLVSSKDGRINPIKLLECLYKELKRLNVGIINQSAAYLGRNLTANKHRWSIYLEHGSIINQDFIIICCGLASEALLKPLDHHYPMEAILGQALELEIETTINHFPKWPAVLSDNGINIIPKSNNSMLMGATLEPGSYPSQACFEEMKNMNGGAPKWIKNANIKRKWHGLRARPLGRPAPLLEELEPGLILATGHYRNGVLLAPATAKWVGQKIEQGN